jgi:hypothetical protein
MSSSKTTTATGDNLSRSRESIAHARRTVYSSRLYRAAPVNSQSAIADLLEACPQEFACASLGYLAVRERAGVALQNAIRICIADGRFDPTLARFGTFSFIDGYSDVDEPLAGLQRQTGRIDKLCRCFKLSAVIFPDIEIVVLPGYPCPLLSYHHHAILAPLNGEPIHPGRLTRAMNARLQGVTLLDKAALVSPKLAGQTAIDRAITIAGYATKITARVKTVTYDEDYERHVRSSRDDMTGTLMLRMLHAWSLLPALENVRGVGDGSLIRKEWKAQLQASQQKARSACEEILTTAQLEVEWQRFWSTAATKPRRQQDQCLRDWKFEAIAGMDEFARDRREDRTRRLALLRQEIVEARRSEFNDLCEFNDL